MFEKLKNMFRRKGMSSEDIQGLRRFAEIEYRKYPQYGYEKMKKELQTNRMENKTQ